MILLILCITVIISFMAGYIFCALLSANTRADLEQEIMFLHQMRREENGTL